MKVHVSLWMKSFKLIFFFSTFIMGQHKSVKSLTCEQLKEFSNNILFLWELYSKDPPLAAPHSSPKFHIQSNSTKQYKPKLPASVPWSPSVEVSCLHWVFLREMLLSVFVVSCWASYVGFYEDSVCWACMLSVNCRENLQECQSHLIVQHKIFFLKIIFIFSYSSALIFLSQAKDKEWGRREEKMGL